MCEISAAAIPQLKASSRSLSRASASACPTSASSGADDESAANSSHRHLAFSRQEFVDRRNVLTDATRQPRAPVHEARARAAALRAKLHILAPVARADGTHQPAPRRCGVPTCGVAVFIAPIPLVLGNR